MSDEIPTACNLCDGSGGIESCERDGRDVVDKCDRCDGTGVEPTGSGVCHCGTSMDQHSAWDNHSPVEMLTHSSEHVWGPMRVGGKPVVPGQCARGVPHAPHTWNNYDVHYCACAGVPESHDSGTRGRAMIRKCPDCGLLFWSRNPDETYCEYDGDTEPEPHDVGTDG